MKVILTGGTGFIGSHVLMQLLREGHEVTVFARNTHKVPALHTTKGVSVLEIGMTDFDKIPAAIQGHDACVHVALNYNDTSAYHMLIHDTAPSIFLASECAKAGIKHFIYTSSTAANDSVYGASNLSTIGDTNCHVTTNCKHAPHSYYGATKAATENFLFGIEGSTGMRVNIVRPGYTFGNPALIGGYTQPDQRFHQIVEAAVKGLDIELIKNDGTQFIWAEDLAKIYTAILDSNLNKQTYFGLSNSFTSWQEIAEQAIKLCDSKSTIILKDLGWSNKPIMFDVSDIKRDFGYSFAPYPHIINHLEYLISTL